MNDEDVELRVGDDDQEIQTWVFQNPDLALLYAARSLDHEADQMGRSQQSRHTRVLATKVWSLYFEIMGLDQYYLLDEHVNETVAEENSNG